LFRVTFGFTNLLATGASLLLLIYVLIAGAGSLLRLPVMGVAIAGGVWAFWFGAVSKPWSSDAWMGSLLAELVLLLSWFGLLERLLRGPYLQSMPELVRRGNRWAWFICVTAILATFLASEGSYAAVLPMPEVPAVALLILALLAFVLTGQLYGDGTIEPHAALRCVCLAAMAVIGLQTYMYAVTLLLSATPAWVITVRAGGIIAASLLLIFGIRFNPQWSLAIFVSQQARVYAPRLLGAGVALSAILAAVPLSRALEPSAARWFAPVCIAVIVILLLLLLYSELLRAQLRVFISKHFLPFRYDYREEWLRLIDTLASPGQERPLPERAIQALAQIVGSPAGVLWMRMADDLPYQCIEAWNTSLKPDVTVGTNDPVIGFMRERQWILDTAELDRRPDLYPGLSRPTWLASFPDALLLVPLIGGETVIGFVVLFQSSSAFRLTFEEIDLLRTSGRQVASHLAQYHADRQLSEARQFEAFNRLTAFVMHDLKNLIAQQSLMVENAARHKGNPAFFEDAMATIENSVARMNKLLQQLQTGDATSPARMISLKACVREAMRKCMDRVPQPIFNEPESDIQAFVDGEKLASVLAHLIRNAQDATDAKGHVSVEIGRSGRYASISVTDDGCGMTEEFVRHRLFRPFDTTKGSQGMGVGAYQARAFVIAAGGMMEVESEPGAGTSIRVRLPAEAPATSRQSVD
jgi:putative PEP-CTERM system histidine kinase